MHPTRFDTLIRTLRVLPDRTATRRSLVAILASGFVAVGFAATPATEARRRKKKKRRGGGGGSDQCPGPVGICNADPTPCGTTAAGEVCGCELTVAGSNACINSGADNVCDTAVECTSTSGSEATSCRNLVGFHFVCQEAKSSGDQFCGCGFGTETGRVCVPECDNPTVDAAARVRRSRARRR